jgi:hypothetical protein
VGYYGGRGTTTAAMVYCVFCNLQAWLLSFEYKHTDSFIKRGGQLLRDGGSRNCVLRLRMCGIQTTSKQMAAVTYASSESSMSHKSADRDSVP